MTIMFTYVGTGRGCDLNILKAFPVANTTVAGVVTKSLTYRIFTNNQLVIQEGPTSLA